jgi:putative hydrolase of the HAD superfamily
LGSDTGQPPGAVIDCKCDLSKRERMELKAITFDLDGTLYPEHRILLPSLKLALRYPRLLYYFSRVRKEIRSVSPITDFRMKQAELVAGYLGRGIPETAALIQRVVYEQWINSIHRMRPFRGLRDFIRQLRSRGLKTALLSDLPIQQKLKYLKMEDIWDFTMTSEDTGYLKPHPAPFERMIQALNIEPRHILYIGNNYRYDVLGARQMGLKTGFLSAKPVHGNLADMTFTRYDQLKKYLISLLEEKK